LSVLILSLVAYIFRTQTIPALLAPLIFVGAILCALPYLQNFVFKGAGFEWSANVLKQDLAEQSATIQGDITEIKKSLAHLLEESGVEIAPTPVRRPSVLVFYGEGQGQLADKARTWLLNAGFDSSATATDFSELGKESKRSGTSELRYVPNFKNQAVTLITKLEATFPQMKPIEQEQLSKLARGDAQLLLF
jgi:hypothetical protein